MVVSELSSIDGVRSHQTSSGSAVRTQPPPFTRSLGSSTLCDRHHAAPLGESDLGRPWLGGREEIDSRPEAISTGLGLSVSGGIGLIAGRNQLVDQFLQAVTSFREWHCREPRRFSRS